MLTERTQECLNQRQEIDCDIEEKIERVEEIRNEYQQADSIDPAYAKTLHDEVFGLLSELEQNLEAGV